MITISRYKKTAPIRLNAEATASKALIVSGVAAAHAKEILKDLKLWDVIPMYQVLQPFPLHQDFVSHMIKAYSEILVIEETTGVIEMQLADRHCIKGKLTGSVPKVGELLPETIQQIISEFAGIDIFEDGKHFAGGSFIFNPAGEMIARAAYLDQDFLFTEINLDEVREIRKKWPYKRDDKPEIILEALKRIVSKYED